MFAVRQRLGGYETLSILDSETVLKCFSFELWLNCLSLRGWIELPEVRLVVTYLLKVVLEWLLALVLAAVCMR